MMEFHISRRARDRYRFSARLFSLTGNVVFESLSASRDLAHRMNRVREAEQDPERVQAGALYTMGLIDEATHEVLARYREQLDPAVMTDALGWFAARVGAKSLDKLLLKFVEQFPGVNVYRGTETLTRWLDAETDGMPNRAAALEEMLLLWMANHNEAFEPFEELFEDSELAAKTAYTQVTQAFPAYFATRPLVEIHAADLAEGGGDDSDGSSALLKIAKARPGYVAGKPVNVTIFDLLRAPALESPASLSGQLASIQKIWKPLLGPAVQRGLAVAASVLHEEEVATWARFHPAPPRGDARWRQGHEPGWENWSPAGQGAGPGTGGEAAPPPEYEKFSPDVEWMPTTVLLAKSTYVWLAQLTKQYGRPITRLDHIPDEELQLLADRGMNSLWLIGVWERSRASQTIKQLCGNADAVASAYSLYDYNIAEDLGGESAYTNLRDRAYRRGIRLASDMVANHMGIDSPWVVEHPDWFLSRQDLPYPAYNFDGPDLSPDPRVEIKIEKHYYDRTDAAVVFRRIDRQSGEMRYIYHGNDGTSFPWNDTAQLDYMNAAVREQVIQTILRVARMFPVIRFDAAMTLAKRHFHRLWFPGPGASGAIPSRAEYSMSDAEFNEHMPHEFWREVVDRVAAEVPGTLLLAEAFWLMEGYFVRTLGMHRVYNSAFMVMLRDEDNANYRNVIKKTLEFDPDIMKRYVNFMSNPDERTAIDQFGSDDKCFGVAAMMSTLPGLPMFGHGQIEGYTEKYGMEYRRPRFDETPNEWLVDRHQRQIAPLLHQRSLFAESRNFRLYDFVRDDGSVEEDVFAYSNRDGDRRGVVLYNNRNSAAWGRIDYSAIYADKGSGEQRQQRLRESLGFTGDSSFILAYHDSLTGLEYLRRATEVAERGLGMELQGYQCHVFLEWRELRATADKRWDRLCDQLNGRGVPDVESALVNLELRPTHDALREVLDPALLQSIAELAMPTPSVEIDDTVETAALPTAFQPSGLTDDVFEPIWDRSEVFFREAAAAYTSLAKPPQPEGVHSPASSDNPSGSVKTSLRELLERATRVPSLEEQFPQPWPTEALAILPGRNPQLTGSATWATVLSWILLKSLAASISPARSESAALDLYDKLRLREPLANGLASLGLDSDGGWRAAARIRVLLLAQAGAPTVPTPVPDTERAPETEAAQQTSAEEEDGLVEPAFDEDFDEVVEEVHNNLSDDLIAELSNPADDELPEQECEATPTDPHRVEAQEAELQDSELLEVERLNAEPLGPRSAVLWQDADMRWLTGLHEAKGQSYFAKEPYEELVWWLQLPALLELAATPTPEPLAIDNLSNEIGETIQEAATAGYRLNAFLGTPDTAAPIEENLDTSAANGLDDLSVSSTAASLPK
jgi:glycosidase